MDSFGVSIQFHVVLIDEILQDFIVASDHSATVKEIKVRDGGINGQNNGLEFAYSHDRNVINNVFFT